MEYLDGTQKQSWTFDDTAAYVDTESNFVVTLYNNPILKIVSKGKTPEKVCIYSGDYYDKYGNPTCTTRERLNGLLDALGTRKVIPQNVRVYYDQDYSICYVIKQEHKVALNKDYCTMVSLKADPSHLIFDDIQLVRAGDRED